MMRVGSERDARAGVPGQLQQVHIEVLSVGIAINLHLFIEPLGFCKNARPVRG